MLDPENLGVGRGGQMGCPRCGKELNVRDLFGIADAFSEEEQADLSLDDLMRPMGDASNPMPDEYEASAQKAGPRQIGQGPSSAADVLRDMKKKR